LYSNGESEGPLRRASLAVEFGFRFDFVLKTKDRLASFRNFILASSLGHAAVQSQITFRFQTRHGPWVTLRA
jgi:hypothetical protein